MFYGTIAPVTLGGSPESNAQLLVVHTYIRLATIRLGMFDSWKGKRLESALAIANMLDDIDVSSIGYMQPVVGVSQTSTKMHPRVESFLLEAFDRRRTHTFGRAKDYY